MRARRLRQGALPLLGIEQSFDRYSHYLFRYPAKFHPPIVRLLIERYTTEGQTILDPFVGSGTLLVEALLLKRGAIGWDVDPVATAVAAVKARRYSPRKIQQSAQIMLASISKFRRPDAEYKMRMHVDLARHVYTPQVRALHRYVPPIPNIEHWFRRYVIVDLARILKVIETATVPSSHRQFFRVVFASIIRNSSNADPVPVSGLEVTSHMRRRDEAGRIIDPFALFSRAVERAIAAAIEFYKATGRIKPAVVECRDATASVRRIELSVDAVITSPPYQGAVDYYRRHTLETYWLGYARSREDRLRAMDRYLGRLKIPMRDPLLKRVLVKGTLASRWETKIRKVSTERANAFRHYINGMRLVFCALTKILRPGAPAIFVIGNSKWAGAEIPTRELFCEVAGKCFKLKETHKYPLKNRYMSYTRHNGADIKYEYVLVMRRTKAALKNS